QVGRSPYLSRTTRAAPGPTTVTTNKSSWPVSGGPGNGAPSAVITSGTVLLCPTTTTVPPAPSARTAGTIPAGVVATRSGSPSLANSGPAVCCVRVADDANTAATPAPPTTRTSSAARRVPAALSGHVSGPDSGGGSMS